MSNNMLKTILNLLNPLFVIPVLGQLFEILVYDQLTAYFKSYNLFYRWQFGFRKNKSTSQVSVKLLRDVIQAYKSKSFVQGTSCDLSKACDCVDSKNLPNKLFHYGVGSLPISSLKSYLNNRIRQVFINGEWSKKWRL